jgi:hypothetical protein
MQFSQRNEQTLLHSPRTLLQNSNFQDFQNVRIEDEDNEEFCQNQKAAIERQKKQMEFQRKMQEVKIKQKM